MKIYNLSCYVLLICFYGFYLQAIVVGSDTTVSKNSFVTFPARDKDNAMLGFASMHEGFALQNAATICIFGSQFPVRKRLELNGGLLTLKTDLMIENIRSLTSLGDIRGETKNEAREVSLPSSLSIFGSSSESLVIFEDIELKLGGNVALTSAIQFEGDCKIVGSGKILDLSMGGELIVASGSSLTLQNVVVTSVANANIRCADNSAQLVLDGMEWIQTDNVVFDMGSILINETVHFIGTDTFAYESACTSTINSDSEWCFQNDIVLRMGKHPVSQAQPLSFEDATSAIVFSNCNFQITNGGITLTKGRAKFEKTVSFEFDSTSTSNGVIVGTNASNEDFTIEFSPASVLNFNSGHFTYNNSNPKKLISQSKSTRVVRHVGSYAYNAQNHTLSKFTLENSSLLVAPTIVDTGKIARFEDVKIILPDFEYDFTGNQFDAVTNLLSGNEYITISNGRVPLAQYIVSTGNVLSGNGVFAGPIIFADASAEAVWSVNGALDSSITFNNGNLILAKDLIMEPNALLLGPGAVNLNNYSIEFPATKMNWATSMRWANGKILLKENISLSQTWTITGNFEIDGRRHLLTLQDGGEIVVAENSTLVLRDIQIDQISGAKIRCIDNTGRIFVDNTKWVLGDDFRYIYGAFQFKHANSIKGNHIFAYQTQMTSTILQNASLTLGQNITFSYDPCVNVQDLLEFIDDSSELVLNRSTIHTTTVGMQFKKGSMRIENDSFIASEKLLFSIPFDDEDETSVLLDEGIIFGDSTTSSNDFYVQVFPGVMLNLIEGSLVLRNIDSSAISLLNAYAAISVHSFAHIKAYENIVLSSGRIIFEDNSFLATVLGNSFEVSIVPRGKLYRTRLTA